MEILIITIIKGIILATITTTTTTTQPIKVTVDATTKEVIVVHPL